jgi:homocysteine S-methyltransferase
MNTETDNLANFLTDGGLETTLIFHEEQHLPEFAAFHLLRRQAGRELLRGYYRKYLEIAADCRAGFVLESPTWRANGDWGKKLGYGADQLREVNRLAVSEMAALRREFGARVPEIVVSGCIGPRGDGYAPASVMSEAEAEAYHATQVRIFADCGVDLVTAMTLNYTAEAIGIVRAARRAGVRPVIAFTVETDARLATGESLREAIERTDARTDGGAAYFMINCAHPTHFERAFEDGSDWVERIGGIRCNASRLSHQELDGSETLDEGDPVDLADRTRRLKAALPALRVFGGCCGTDYRHVQAMAKALAPAPDLLAAAG